MTAWLKLAKEEVGSKQNVILLIRMKKIDRKSALVLAGVFGGLAMLYFLAAVVIPTAIINVTSKAAPATKVSISDSFIVGQKILARADGKDKCIVNVFVLDKRPQGVVGKSVVVEGIEGVKSLTQTTGEGGKITFEAVSEKEGQFELTAFVEGVALARGVTCTFR